MAGSRSCFLGSGHCICADKLQGAYAFMKLTWPIINPLELSQVMGNLDNVGKPLPRHGCGLVCNDDLWLL